MLSQVASAEPGKWRTGRTPYLKEIMDCLSPSSPTERVVFMKGAQVGAPLDLETQVPTPDGFVTIADIQAGDKVFDENGQVQIVLGTSDIFENEECYEVTFDDGTVSRCDGRHLWTVERSNFKGRFNKVTIRTDAMVKDYKKGNRNRYRIPNAQPIRTDEKALPIDPYTLGAWLGDGNRCSNRICAFTDDAEAIAAMIRKGGHRAKVEKTDKRYDSVRDIVIDYRDSVYCKRGHKYAEAGREKNGSCKACHKITKRIKKYGTLPNSS